MNYTNREVVRRLKQYDMFINSLKLTTDEMQKERICDQLDKIEKQILLETNTEYEEEYMTVLGEEAKFLEEEKNKLRKLISIINSRRDYLNDRKKKHKDVTGSLVELTTFLGEDKLTMYKKNLKIIEKYEENKTVSENIIRDMKDIDVKISSASRNVKANTRLNDMLENKMINLIERTLEKLGLYNLANERDELNKKYDSLKYAVDMANDNLNSAKELDDSEMILECNDMLAQITTEYNEYNEKINILKLIDMYESPVSGYEELLEKREKINDILKNIENHPLYHEIAEELNKEYNTIKLEKQDIDTYENLKEEREKKNKILYTIEEENNSKEFKEVLDRLIKNEKNYRDEQVRRARKIENEERERKFLENKRIEEARVKRQKLIEDARLKDQLERAEKLKKLQEKTAINLKKEDSLPKKEKIDEVIKEDTSMPKMNNPLENKTFDDIILSDDFNSKELFENTRIVPNKVNREDMNMNNVISSNENILPTMENVFEESKLDIPTWEPIENTTSIYEQAVNKEEPTYEKTEDLFKEEPLKIDITANEMPNMDTPKEENTKKANSIYDLLEDSNNIIWQTTETKPNEGIPIIGNNNLKPEIINKKNDVFPEIGNKGGDILWKETL